MTTETDETNTPAEAAKQPRFSKKKKIIAAAGAVVLLGGGTGGAMMFMGGDKAAAESDHGSADEGGHGEAESGGHGEGGEASFVDVPPMVVNLRTSDGQARFLKLHFLIVPSNADKKAEIEEKMPLIIDRYQPFLRELRPEDLAGSAAVYRIKEELILRAGEIVGTGGVSDVLIQDLIQQ